MLASRSPTAAAPGLRRRAVGAAINCCAPGSDPHSAAGPSLCPCARLGRGLRLPAVVRDAALWCRVCKLAEPYCVDRRLGDSSFPFSPARFFIGNSGSLQLFGLRLFGNGFLGFPAWKLLCFHFLSGTLRRSRSDSRLRLIVQPTKRPNTGTFPALPFLPGKGCLAKACLPKGCLAKRPSCQKAVLLKVHLNEN